jgi:peptidyl-prolyl cis-trans isomerase D
MLEYLRKHTLVVMGAMVLVFFGLVFIESNSSVNLGERGPAVVKVGNISYTRKDYDKVDLQFRLISYTQSLRPMFQMLSASAGSANPAAAFLANCGILRQEAERYGIYPSTEEIDATIKKFPDFCKEDGSFNRDAYRELVSIRGKQGISEVEESLRELVGDYIRLIRLESIVTDGVIQNEAFSKAYYQSIAQNICTDVAFLDKMSFRPKTDPGEEELRQFWTQRTLNYLSDEERQLTVYYFAPKAQIVESADTKIPAATLEVLNVVEPLWEKITDANGKGLQEAIDQFSQDFAELVTVTKTQYNDVTSKAAPADLQEKLNPAAGAQQNTIAEAAFALADNANQHAPVSQTEDGQPATTPTPEAPAPAPTGLTADLISNALVLDDGRIAIVCVDKIVPVSPLSYEKARAAARADYIDNEAEVALEKAANNLKEQVSAENADFKALAQAAGAQVSSWGPYNTNKLPEKMIEPAAIHEALRKVNVGDVSDPIVLSDGIVLAKLTKKTIEDTPELRSTETNIVNFMDMNAKRLQFAEWLQNCFTKYNVTFAAGYNMSPHE